jgi:hypothetical protein
MILTSAARDEIPKAKFGLPGQRKYPMPDRAHAANAKARAKQQLDAGHISSSEYNEIVRKANVMLVSHAMRR